MAAQASKNVRVNFLIVNRNHEYAIGWYAKAFWGAEFFAMDVQPKLAGHAGG
jgi:hypothetical protein